MTEGSTVRVVHDLTDGERALAARVAEATEQPRVGQTVLERPSVDWERHRGDKRPKIKPPPGGVWRNPGTNRKVGHRYYTRVTTFADAITESYNLTQWKLARLLIGLGQRADYVRQAAALTMDERDRDARDELVGKVFDAAGPDAAGLGTALHALTERLDRGEDLGTPPVEMLPDLAAYTALTSDSLTMLLREPRTVCDELECAGTPDTIAVVHEAPPTDWGPACDCPPGRARVVDTKTGSIRYPGKMSTQLSIYAHSELYNAETGERTPLDVCPHWGVIVHLPVETGEAALFWLDLAHGWRGAELCGPVRQWHRAKADDVLRPFATVMPVKVVDGEVLRMDPRLASTNTKAPAQVDDVTDQLAASLAIVATEIEGADDARGSSDLDPVQRDDEGDEAALHEDLDPVQQAFAEAADGIRPHRYPTTDAESEALRLAQEAAPLITRAEAERLIPVAPGPDTCAHSGGRTMSGNRLICRDCREPAGFGDGTPTPPAKAEPFTIDERIAAVERGDDPDADDPVHDHLLDDPIAERSSLDPAPDAERTAMLRDEPWRLNDESERIDQQLTESADPGEGEPEVERHVPYVPQHPNDRDGELVARGFVLNDEPPERPSDPLGDEIRRCTSVRELEQLGTTRWREWNGSHRALAVEVHDRLAFVERVERPRAACEAAIGAASTLDELGAVMAKSGGAEWITDELLKLGTARWHELRGAR